MGCCCCLPMGTGGEDCIPGAKIEVSFRRMNDRLHLHITDP